MRAHTRLGDTSIWRAAVLAAVALVGGLELPAQGAEEAKASSAPMVQGGDAPAAEPQAAAGSYTIRLRELERRVDELKEQIFRSKARLNLLKETVLHGIVAGARAVILHRNEMGALYVPIRIVYALDGAEIFSKSDESGKLLERGKELEVFNGSIPPGNHTLSVMVVYQGNGFGVFSYLKGYKFTVRGSHTFTAPEGKVTTIRGVGYEKGNPLTTDPAQRPELEFRTTVGSEHQSPPKRAK
ncbi:MAG: dihydrolipoamide acetyltransferase [Myxococcales bacterium]|nr:dihydrolipoamide acetyltransferase [Myxococcota bacterium]MDW8280727.1 dihydrolipoamide acetyltransferase [Myxococcales bacterium]